MFNRREFLGVFAGAAASGFIPASASADPASQPVHLYGVDLYPQNIVPNVNLRYGFPTWDELADLFESVFPDSRIHNLSPEELCDRLVHMTDEVGGRVDRNPGDTALQNKHDVLLYLRDASLKAAPEHAQKMGYAGYLQYDESQDTGPQLRDQRNRP